MTRHSNVNDKYTQQLLAIGMPESAQEKAEDFLKSLLGARSDEWVMRDEGCGIGLATGLKVGKVVNQLQADLLQSVFEKASEDIRGRLRRGK